MARLVDDLLSLSRIEQTLHVQPRAAVDLAAVAEHVCDALCPLAQDSRIQLAMDVRATVVRGDRDEFCAWPKT